MKKEAKELQIIDILSCKVISIIRVKYYEKDTFIMDFHVYKAAWTPSIGEMLSGVMESSNIMNKQACICMQGSGTSFTGKMRKTCKDNFSFFESRQRSISAG